MEHTNNNVKLGKTSCNNKEFKRCRWGVTNKHLHTNLSILGCTPRKSLILQFPKDSIFKESKQYSKKELIRHFIRGYFDGDGCISFTYANKFHTKYSPIALIVGTEKFLKQL